MITITRENNMELMMEGQGNNISSGIPGDLIILIEEQEHELFTRKGNSIFYDLYISYHDTLFGGSVEIQTLDGRVKVDIEKGTESGKILKLNKKGLPAFNNKHGMGDMFLFINIFVPKNISKQDKEKLQLYNYFARYQ